MSGLPRAILAGFVLALLWSKTPGAAYAGSDAAVSVTAYGAVCDGVTDDSARINSAIAAVYRAGGGDLTFPTDRICGITARLTLYPNVHLRGLGGSTIKLLANIGDYAIAGIAAHNSGVSDLTFDAGDYDGGPTSAAIAWQNSNGVSVRRVQIVNQGRFGIVLNGGANYDFLDNTISCRAKNSTICGTSAQNQAILVASSLPSGGGRIAGNTLTGSGMDIATANSAIVYNTITHWHFGGGITTEQASNAYGLTIVGNVTTGGIGTDANNTVVLGLEQWAPDSYIAFNYSADNDGDGIDIGGLNNTVDRNVTVDNSQIKKGLLDGIVCRYGTPDYNCSNSTFIGNRSYNSAGRDGPQKYAYAEQSASVAGVTLIGNDFPDNAAGGAHILSGSTQIR